MELLSIARNHPFFYVARRTNLGLHTVLCLGDRLSKVQDLFETTRLLLKRQVSLSITILTFIV